MIAEAMVFQSTFPRGERPQADRIMHDLYDISIHVPSWGTTKDEKGGIWFDDISIHVPSWGTTLVNEYLNMIGDISIHVPSWGTTQTRT